MRTTFACDGCDVVLDENGNSMEWSTRTEKLPFDVESLRLFDRAGIHLDDCAQRRPLKVNLFDTSEVDLL